MRPSRSGSRLRRTPGRSLTMKMSSTSTLVTSDKRPSEARMDMAMGYRIMICPHIINPVALPTHMVKAPTC